MSHVPDQKGKAYYSMALDVSRKLTIFQTCNDARHGLFDYPAA